MSGVRAGAGFTPTDGQHFATKAYVDSKAGSGGTTGGTPVYVQQNDPALTTSYVWYQVDASGNPVNVWVNYVAAVAALTTETWTGSDGAAWPAQWQVVTIGQAAATIQGGRGRMLTNGGAYNNGVTAYLPGMGAVADSETYVEVTFDGTVTEQYVRVGARVQANDAAGGPPATGYLLTVAESSGAVLIALGNGNTLASVTVSSGGFVSSTWGVRFRLVGSTLQWRMWNLTGSEPAAWTQTVTDTTYATAGRLHLSAQNGNDGAQRFFDLDNLRVNAAS